nr:hypothetical protein [Tanacetum cinerariifolium]
MPITTVEEKAQRRLEVKAISTLMMGIPNEHQLKFNSIKDAKQLLKAIEKRFDQEKEYNVNITNNANTVGLTVNAAGTNEDNKLPFDPNMPALEDVSIFKFLNDDEDDGPMDDMNNLDTTIQVSPILTTRIHKQHPLGQVIGDLHSATQTRRMSKNLEEHGFVRTI